MRDLLSFHASCERESSGEVLVAASCQSTLRIHIRSWNDERYACLPLPLAERLPFSTWECILAGLRAYVHCSQKHTSHPCCGATTLSVRKAPEPSGSCCQPFPVARAGAQPRRPTTLVVAGVREAIAQGTRRSWLLPVLHGAQPFTRQTCHLHLQSDKCAGTLYAGAQWFWLDFGFHMAVQLRFMMKCSCLYQDYIDVCEVLDIMLDFVVRATPSTRELLCSWSAEQACRRIRRC